jgi:hypothetical protein
MTCGQKNAKKCRFNKMPAIAPTKKNGGQPVTLATE